MYVSSSTGGFLQGESQGTEQEEAPFLSRRCPQGPWPPSRLRPPGALLPSENKLVFTSASLLLRLLPRVHGNILVPSLDNFLQCRYPAKDNFVSLDFVLFSLMSS